jgi:site-specific recombinase XerD
MDEANALNNYDWDYKVIYSILGHYSVTTAVLYFNITNAILMKKLRGGHIS